VAALLAHEKALKPWVGQKLVVENNVNFLQTLHSTEFIVQFVRHAQKRPHFDQYFREPSVSSVNNVPIDRTLDGGLGQTLKVIQP
jgi:hypothetical protein